jgi:hypothetical protein
LDKLGDGSCQRRHEQMPAEHDVNGPVCLRCRKRCSRVCELAWHRAKLPKANGYFAVLAMRNRTLARQYDDLFDRGASRERGQKMSIVLRNPAVPTECVRHQRKNSQASAPQAAAT